MAPIAKRRKLNQLSEIKFDPEARQEYLTGFHKRKQQRKEHAKEEAVKREKAERIIERKQIRDQRKDELEQRVAEVNAEMRKQRADAGDLDSSIGSGDERYGWEGIEDVVPEVAQDEEYVDEDKYTTVTVEAMPAPGEESEDDDAEGDLAAMKVNGESTQIANKKRIWPKDANKAKVKKKKFRYESKGERQATRQKQKTKSRASKARREGK